MQKVFNLLRANDLIWSLVVNKCPLSQSRSRSTCSVRMQTARERRPYCALASTNRDSLSFGGPVRFVPGGAGHIARVINLPSTAQCGYWIGVRRPAEPQARFVGARQNQGSWWLD